MSVISMLLKEMDAEAAITRRMLSRVPDDKFDWKPHEKSMTIRQLSTHLAELPSWVSMALTTDELDFAKSDYTPTPVNSCSELLDLFDKSRAEGKGRLENATDEDLGKKWILRSGDQVYMEMTKGETIRHAFSQTVHHRAQLGVYFRLLDIPVPPSYGPTADEDSF